MSPRRLKRLLKRNDPRPTEAGMRVTPAYLQWRGAPRKWISIQTANGNYFLVEDRKR